MRTSRSPSPASPLNIYDTITANRRRALLLLGGFVLLVAAVSESIGIIVGLPIMPATVVMAVLTGLAVLVAVWVYYNADSTVLSISEAIPVLPNEHPELYRTVENLCIGSGMPVPKIYIIDDSALNAFSVGRDPKHASVAITKGLLEKLDKLELEGVMAHELSHIGNLDTRLMVITAVLVGFVALMVDVTLRLTWYGAGARPRNRGKGEGGVGVVMLALAIICIVLAPIAAKLIQMALSRQREYLADASAALLTRYPEGLARALEKLEKDTEPLEVANKATAHLYITNPLKGHESSLNDLFDTHPPIRERIARLRQMGAVV